MDRRNRNHGASLWTVRPKTDPRERNSDPAHVHNSAPFPKPMTDSTSLGRRRRRVGPGSFGRRLQGDALYHQYTERAEI